MSGNVEGLRRQATSTRRGEQSIGELDGQYYRRDGNTEPTADNSHSLGSVSARLANVHSVWFTGTATSAQYSDLAEIYESDMELEPGDIVKIGGDKEITKTDSFADIDVFGIVSTDPAYLMNSEGKGYAIALAGRVPCKVQGKVKKGQRLVSDIFEGVARAVDKDSLEKLSTLAIIGRALEDKDTDEVGLVEVAVGKN
jgi:hypothetical protein